MTKKRKISHVKKKKVSKEIDIHIRTMLASNLFVIDQRVSSIVAEMNTMKLNLMTTQNLLEKNKIIKKEEFYKEYEVVSKALFGSLDGDGKLSGNSVFSLYDA
jgi:hypothetical protein